MIDTMLSYFKIVCLVHNSALNIGFEDCDIKWLVISENTCRFMFGLSLQIMEKNLVSSEFFIVDTLFWYFKTIINGIVTS